MAPPRVAAAAGFVLQAPAGRSSVSKVGLVGAVVSMSTLKVAWPVLPAISAAWKRTRLLWLAPESWPK